ncbi:MAG TPA: SIR2 family protein [Fibrobacteria bacterium]|nr:SIR2 family protein [Fibrobacteria bacterium]
MDPDILETIREALASGDAIPYLGPGVLRLVEDCPVPATAEDLVKRLVTKASVPHKLLKNLTGAAQFLENFKHRRTVVAGMTEAFRSEVRPSPLHGYLASLPLPLIVHAWYDDLPRKALEGRADWVQIQGVSQAEHFGEWTHRFGPDGARIVDGMSESSRKTILYEPMGSVSPAANYLVSDSDYVEVLTEIDIQTPVPASIQEIRRGRHFLFLGCRFNTQLERIFAHQVSKRSSDAHWAVLPETPTRNENRFMDEHGIERLDLSLAEFAKALLEPQTRLALAS